MTAQVLGNARQGGTIKFALEAIRRLRECREVALLLSSRGDVILLRHWDPEYTDALTRKQAHLCCVDRMPEVPDAPAGVSVATYVGYLVASLVVLPLAVGWSWAERSRGGTATILVGLVVVPYLFVRLYQVWVLRQ